MPGEGYQRCDIGGPGAGGMLFLEGPDFDLLLVLGTRECLQVTHKLHHGRRGRELEL